jgi:putative tryptophan/tyrosine transport system substrate-binding protein
MREEPRRFPAPCHVDKIPGGYVVRDANQQVLAYVYARATSADAIQAKVLTQDEARRIAINIARLPNCCATPIVRRKCGDYPCYDRPVTGGILMLGSRTSRRAFITGLGGAAAWPLMARAQQPAATPVVGYLEGASQAQFLHLISALDNGLSDEGYVDGQNIRIEYRWADGHYDRLPTLAAELLQHHPSVILATSFASALAAKDATSVVPIVFVSGPDPVQLGLVASLSRPRYNLTGFSIFSSALATKRLELLRELSPTMDTFAFIVNSSNPRARYEIQDMEAAAHSLVRELIVLKAESDHELEVVFASLPQRRVQASVIGGDPFFNSRAQQLVTLASQYRIPTIYPLREFTAAGGLMSYGASFSNAYRQAGAYVGRILKGEKPADMPVSQPTTFDLVINLNTAKALGLNVPAKLLARADEVIE